MIDHNTSPPSPANLSPTAILDFSHANVQRLVATVSQANISSRTFLQMMHLHLVQVIRPVYSVKERQPVSATLERGRGSCSQRMASLEAAARVAGIPTRTCSHDPRLFLVSAVSFLAILHPEEHPFGLATVFL